MEDQDKGAEDTDKKGNDNLLNDIAVMQKGGIIEESTHHTLRKGYKCNDNCTVPLYIKLESLSYSQNNCCVALSRM